MIAEDHIKTLEGRFWRSSFLGQEESLLSPPRAPQGRWHHSGQKALYLSGSPEGCRVALKVYLSPEDPPRGIYPIDVQVPRLLDLRDPDTRHAMGITLADMHVFWADLHVGGKPVPTWEISDRLRDAGASGLLTPSRSRPDLTHLTLLRWNDGSGALAKRAGEPLAWEAG